MGVIWQKIEGEFHPIPPHIASGLRSGAKVD